MPKTKSFDARIHAIVQEHLDELVASVADAVRRHMANDLESYLLGGSSPSPSRGPSSAARATAGKQRRILPCIAPGCSNPSKGPRFHYLCEKHRNASKKDYEAWRKNKQ